MNSCVGFRELAEPQKLLTYLLHPSISILAADTVQLYLQAAVKVFGFLASELAQRWDNDDLPKIREVVDLIISRMTDFASSSDIEVQERVSHAYCLLH